MNITTKLSKKEFNSLLAGFPEAENVERIGLDIYLYSKGSSKCIKFGDSPDSKMSAWFKEYKTLKDGTYLLTYTDGDKCFYHPESGRGSVWCKSDTEGVVAGGRVVFGRGRSYKK